MREIQLIAHYGLKVRISELWDALSNYQTQLSTLRKCEEELAAAKATLAEIEQLSDRLSQAEALAKTAERQIHTAESKYRLRHTDIRAKSERLFELAGEQAMQILLDAIDMKGDSLTKEQMWQALDDGARSRS